MNVHVQLDPLACSELVKLSFECLVLHRVSRGLSLEILGARRRASPLALVPVVGPVAVDVRSDAAGAANSLAVLAPHAVVGLRVGKAVRVDDREDVEVVLVLERLVIGIGGREKLVGGIFYNHGGNPLSGMHSSVPNNGLLATLASTSPNVDSTDGASLERISCRYDLGVVGEGRGQILEPLSMLSETVVGVEPCGIRSRRRCKVG